ncbi:MAG: DUF3995 domain-containing protein [Ktedonobacteraceae bacterium]
MNEPTKQRAGMVVAAVLAADGLLHAYWATGRTWPASDPKSLSEAVLNVNIVFGPLNVGPLAGLLLCAALLVLARVHRLGVLGRLIPDTLLQVVIVVVAVGLLLRGLAGIGWVVGLGANPGTTFYKLNLLVYTPTCLMLFVAAVAASRSERAKRKTALRHELNIDQS